MDKILKKLKGKNSDFNFGNMGLGGNNKFSKNFGNMGLGGNNKFSKNFGNTGLGINNTLSKNFGIGGMTNQKGASQKMQSMWANMTTPQRAAMRRTHIDSDGDGVPDKWDCKPFDKYKQDSDEYYEKSHWEIELGPTDEKGYFRVHPKKYYDEDDEPVGAFTKDEMKIMDKYDKEIYGYKNALSYAKSLKTKLKVKIPITDFTSPKDRTENISSNIIYLVESALEGEPWRKTFKSYEDFEKSTLFGKSGLTIKKEDKWKLERGERVYVYTKDDANEGYYEMEVATIQKIK